MKTSVQPASSTRAGGLRRKYFIWIWLVILGAIHYWAAIGTEISPAKFLQIGNSIEFIKESLPPRWDIVPRMVEASVLTIQIALMGTTLALVVAFPIAFLAARNTNRFRPVYYAARSILSFFRAVPEIVIGLIMVPAIGLGPFPGVIALAMHNFGVLGKLISELVESSDRGPQEAVASTGANGTLVMLYGIVPQIIPDVLSQAFYRFEVNIRATLVLGMFGAGGIGHELFLSFRTFRYQEVLVQVLAIVALVILVDMLGGIVRRRFI